MRRVSVILVVLATACGGTTATSTTSTTIPASSTSTTTVTPPSTTSTTAAPARDRESGIQFTELLTLDRLGSGDGAPVAILIHGGGWFGGDRSSTEPLADALVENGFVVINATYRTAAGGFPESVEDVACATVAGRQIAAEVGGTGPVILVGHSAGAHIASLVALAGDEFEPADCTFEGTWEPLDGFVGLAGPYKIQNLFGLLDDWMGASKEADPDLWARAVPESYVDRQPSMPIRLVHGDADRVVALSFSALFRDELVAEGRDVALIEIPDGTHSSMLTPLIDIDVTVQVLTELADLASLKAVESAVTVQGNTVVIDVTAIGFDLRFVSGDTSGETGHIHAYVDRPPPEAGDVVPLRTNGIVHSASDRLIVGGLSAGEHVIWLVVADGADRALIPPEPVRIDVTIEG